MHVRPIVIVGAGGMGREALAWVRDCLPEREVAGFLDDRIEPGVEVAGSTVLGTVEWLGEHVADCVVAIGSPEAKSKAVARVAASGADLVTMVHPSAYIGPNVSIGAGSIICPNVTLTRDIRVGVAAIVNYGAQVGHDCQIGDYAFIAPGVNLAGTVTVGDGAEVGIGVSAIQGVTMGAWSRIGAGAAVIDDIPAGVTAVGVPCRPLTPD